VNLFLSVRKGWTKIRAATFETPAVFLLKIQVFWNVILYRLSDCLDNDVTSRVTKRDCSVTSSGYLECNSYLPWFTQSAILLEILVLEPAVWPIRNSA
jgi:hypothetical protein